MLEFPKDWLWGISTAAHQFEGGNVLNQWHHWEQTGGVRSRDRCGAACNWWHDAESDLARCAALGVNVLRVSVEWSRLEPRPGEWNRVAMARYRSLLRSIRARGMRPIITLHHFTHPQWFEELGAFTHHSGPSLFAHFAARVQEQLGDLCSDWVTLNEPNVFTAFGYLFGEFPPGRRLDMRATMLTLMGLHEAHALAYERLHRAQADARVGLAVNYIHFKAASHSPFDRWLARVYHELYNLSSLYFLRDGALQEMWWLPKVEVPDAKGAVDFIGLNVYNRLHVRINLPFGKYYGPGGLFVPQEAPQGDRGAEYPYGEACPEVVKMAVRSYAVLRKPMLVLENGVPDRADRIRPWVMVNTVRHLYELWHEGYDVRGYFHWSIVDNFEWSQGWTLRFGLYELDPRTQERRARPSAELYRAIIAQNGLSAEQIARYKEAPPPAILLPKLPVLRRRGAR